MGDVWRAGLVVAGVVALALFLRFVLIDAGSLVMLLVMAWFTSLTMEPAVRRLTRPSRKRPGTARMRRATAALLVMGGFIVVALVFLVLFGSLFVQQVALLLGALPDVVGTAVDWVNARLGTRYDLADILASLNLTPAQAAQYAQGVLGGVLGLLGTLVGAVFDTITLLLLTFYFSADGPRLRRWLSGFLPGRPRGVFIRLWELSTEKTGGYVSSRVILAAINSGASALVFVVIGLPSWLALGVWTGVIAQFVPTIGTYISIVLPAVVGLASDRPWTGAVALAWGVVYQQVENLSLEPKISARAVDIHPGVSFAAVILGASLFGAVGAVLAVPVVAMLISLADTYLAGEHEPGSHPSEGDGSPAEEDAPGVPDAVSSEAGSGEGAGPDDRREGG
ncbi:AI-2E family transporter [Spongiactinospora sp. TRM90649]|uniref:AI-2E family transporter n=1 Tax=Spongiactinospora sp. TRM90649 TaxID=3031114 RepID=UPI0023F6E76B|nr:AI-2E family transporter [Spongiactinospora sp. TRM90649]MDF5751813.1 AI-2E family transporter [Spongiactinospora sp. TRM90649]